MIVRPMIRVVGAAAIAWMAMTYAAQAQQQQPTPAAVALAAQLLEIKGGLGAFDPAIDGVISHHKSILLQINPNLTKDIDAVSAMMRGEVAARRAELHREVATGFATVFSEQDLKDLIAFYKTPLGKKFAEFESRAGQESTKRAQEWVEKYAETTMARMRAEMKKRGHTEF
jgi:uncharacterized protein